MDEVLEKEIKFEFKILYFGGLRLFIKSNLNENIIQQIDGQRYYSDMVQESSNLVGIGRK